MDKLNGVCSNLIKSLVIDDHNLTIETLQQILTLLSHESYKVYRFDLSGLTDREDDICRFIKCFLDILPILNVRIMVNKSNGKTQELEEVSIGSLLQKVLAHDYHSMVSKCCKYNEKDDICKNGHDFSAKGMHEFTCDYHTESLATHLVLASIMSGFKALTNKNLSDREVTILQLIALLHDIGKTATVQTLEYKKLVTAFPCHGEVGRLMLLPFFCKEMKEYLSEQEFMAICDTIGRHMCGYNFGKQEGANIYKRDLLSSEDDLVKQYLLNLRYGDHFGKMSIPSLMGDQEEYVTEESFENSLLNTKFDPKMFFEKYGFRNKMVIYLIGTSGAGKGYLAKMIQKSFDKVEHVERDVCIAEAMVGVSERFLGVAYGQLYRIYDLQKELFKTKKSDKKYLDLEQNLIIAQTEWNDENDQKIKIHEVGSPISDPVLATNTIFRNKIEAALNDVSCRIVMIDTMMTLFPNPDQHLPSAIKDCFIVHIHVQNFCLRENGDNIGGTVEQQLAVSGPFAICDPLHPGTKKGNHLKALSSISIDSKTHKTLKIVPECFQTSPFRPHIVTSVVRTLHGQIGYNQALELLRKFIL